MENGQDNTDSDKKEGWDDSDKPEDSRKDPEEDSGEDSDETEKKDKDEKEDSSKEEDIPSKSESDGQDKNDEKESAASGGSSVGGSSFAGTGSTSKNETELDESEPECAHLEGCVDGKHDEDCPCYEGEDGELLPDAECAHLAGCVGDAHDQDCPLYEDGMLELLTAKTAENIYEVATSEELSEALADIESSTEDEAIIVLNNDFATANFSGVDGKHIIITSTDGNQYKLSIGNREHNMNGDVTFDNVETSCYSLYCNGYKTIFTENSILNATKSVFGGANGCDVNGDTYLELNGESNINGEDAVSVAAGSYNGNVDGNTYLKITGVFNTLSGKHISGTNVSSSTAKESLYVDGNVEMLIDIEPTSQSAPTIDGTYGSEIKGNLNITVKSGTVKEICAQQGSAKNNTIDGDVHLTIGDPGYHDRFVTTIGNWSVSGAGNQFAYVEYNRDKLLYKVNGNVTIDTYENFCGWDKISTDIDDMSDIYGARYADILGDITLNIKGSSSGNIYGCGDSNINGNITIDIQNAYGGKYVNGSEDSSVSEDISISIEDSKFQSVYGCDDSQIAGTVIVNASNSAFDDGAEMDSNIPGDNKNGGSVQGVDGKSSVKNIIINVQDGSTYQIVGAVSKAQAENIDINVSGSTLIRGAVVGHLGRFDNNAIINFYNARGNVPAALFSSQLNVKNESNLILGRRETEDDPFVAINDLCVDSGSFLETLDMDTELLNNAVVEDGVWVCRGNLEITGNLTGNKGCLYFGKPSIIAGNAVWNETELRLPVVSENNYQGNSTNKIPLWIGGLSSGTTTVYTVAADDWQTLQAPVLQDNYIVSAKFGDDPIQSVFLLGNEDALETGLYLKRLDDPGNRSTNYMWQIANGISVIFDKNGGDTDASPRIESKELLHGQKYYHFDLPSIEPTKSGCKFTGWNTAPDGSGEPFTAETKVTASMRVYAQWESGYATITPMDITIYTGGEGYSGVIGSDNTFISNDFPEMGYYFTLPDEINAVIQNSLDNPIDLSEKLVMTYDDENGTTREWSIKLYGEEKNSKTMVDGRHCYIYKMLPSNIDGTDELVPLRIQFTDTDGNVMADSDFQVSDMDQYRDYDVNFFTGDLDPDLMRIEITANGKMYPYKVILGTGSLKIRGNVDNHYAKIEYGTPTVNQENPHLMLASAQQRDTTYYINDSGIKVMDPSGIRLFVDESMDDAYLENYINQNKNANGKYVYQARYLDLVDTNNGNVYLKMGQGQKMNIYWPVPEDAKADSEFHMVRFKAFHREHDGDMDELLQANPPEEHFCEKVTISGQEFLKFTVESFSPFVLLYEKEGTINPGGNGSHGSGSHGGSSGGHSSGSVSTSTGTVQQGTTNSQIPETEEQKEAVAADTAEGKEEEVLTQVLPKTGQKKEDAMFTLLSSGFLLLLLMIRKKKQK